MTQRTNSFRNNIQRILLLGVLTHEHQMQAVELRPGDIPVKVMRHQIKSVAIGEQCGKAIYDFLAIFVTNTNIDLRDLIFFCTHNIFSFDLSAMV